MNQQTKRRLHQLEQRTGRRRIFVQWPDVHPVGGGQTGYTEGDQPVTAEQVQTARAAGQDVTVIHLTYTHDWRGDGQQTAPTN